LCSIFANMFFVLMSGTTICLSSSP
jgi:hypothetical protein